MLADNNDGAWFKPRRYGLGLGTPIVWQGWALLGGYLAVVAVMLWVPHLNGDRLDWKEFALFFALTAGFTELARRRTRGGWKWRWGGSD